MTSNDHIVLNDCNDLKWIKIDLWAKSKLLAQCVAHGGLALRNVVCFTKKPFSQTHFCKTSSVFFSQQSYNRSARKKAERRLKSNTLACSFNFLTVVVIEGGEKPSIGLNVAFILARFS